MPHSDLSALATWCESQSDWIVETAEALGRLESPSTDKAAVDRCGEELAARLGAIGGRVERLRRENAGDHLRAEFGRGDRQVLLLGHFDTVWPVGQIARMPIRREAGRLHGPGIFDMKAGIALGMAAARALIQRGTDPGRRVVMLWTTDEEIGSRTSRGAIEEEARRSEAVFVLEPALPGGAVKTSRKGCGEFEIVVSGVAAHAGIDPGKGASAIHELARQITAVERLQDPGVGISVNVGVVSGGTRPNVVAEEARANVDVRAPRLADARRIEAAFAALAPVDSRTRLTVRGGFDRPPLERGPGVARLYELARDIAARLGRTLDEGGTGGGSDGNFTAALGVPTLDGLGAVGDGAHAIHEHVVINELPWRAALLAALLQLA
ncbi:MAG TPA: M20 family metallopeptidase [Vicinamibacterales bacterium]|jgi:glutamate carboxypeptidase|nr:M20 family metallopeptidase [Vicinamibacterales bacterium]